MLKINRLTVSVDQQPILHQLDLKVKPGQTHALMGPNGSGKSTLAFALMGHPHYQVDSSSQVVLDSVSLLNLSPDERAHEGLYLAFQYPLAIPGVSVQNALKSAYEAIHCTGCSRHEHCPKLSVSDFRRQLTERALSLGIDPVILTRSLNDGFSGGEKKRLEMLTLLTLKPKYAILDETDSGLDIDSLKIIAQAIQSAVKKDHLGVLLITHYRRILDYVKPDKVSVIIKGRIVKSDGPALLDAIESGGYSQFI